MAEIVWLFVGWHVDTADDSLVDAFIAVLVNWLCWTLDASLVNISVSTTVFSELKLTDVVPVLLLLLNEGSNDDGEALIDTGDDSPVNKNE